MNVVKIVYLQLCAIAFNAGFHKNIKVITLKNKLIIFMVNHFVIVVDNKE